MPPLLSILLIQRLRWLDSELQDRDWFVRNSFTAADFMMSFLLEATRQRAGLDERYPNILAGLEKIHDRPACHRVLERGGDYA